MIQELIDVQEILFFFNTHLLVGIYRKKHNLMSFTFSFLIL